MIIKIAKYTIKAGKEHVVNDAIRLFVSEIKNNEPDTYYEAYQIKNSLDFIHLMRFPHSEAENAHSNANYTNKFVKTLYPACVKNPEFIDLLLIE